VSPDTPRRGGRRWLLVLRLVIGLALLWAVLTHVGGDKILAHLRSIDPWLFGLACLLLLFGQVLNAWRWRWLLGTAMPDPPGLLYLYSLVMAGMFFNFLLPSTVGGDVVRAEMVKARVGGRVQAYFSIAVSRLLGFLGVLALGVMAVAAAYVSIGWYDPELMLAAGAVVLPLLVFFGWMLKGPSLGRWLVHLPLRARSAASRVQDAMAAYAAYPAVLWRVFLMAIFANAVGTVGVVWALAGGLAVPAPALFHFIAVPLVMLISLVPVSINGIGLREGAFAYLYAKVGVEASAAVSLSLGFTAVLALLSVVGGLVLLLPRHAWPVAVPESR
jgi:glycosyltransferase 2 family protein